MKLLLIEPPTRLQKSLTAALRGGGYVLDTAPDGNSGLRFALTFEYGAVLLDLMPPGRDGLTVLQKIRAHGLQTPVLILSAQGQVAERIRCLELGADDFLIKPFHVDELYARVKALVRRRYAKPNPLIRFGAVELNTALHQVGCHGTPVPLTPHELTLLEYLALNRGRVLSIETLAEHLYAGEVVVSKNAIEAHISSLRKKLRVAGAHELIKTRRGFGYFIDA